MRVSSLLLPALLLAAALPACTEVTENFPEGGCVPESLKCVGNDVARCLEDGSKFEVFKVCDPESPCSGDPPDCPAVVGGASCESDEECVAQLGSVGACYVPSCVEGACTVVPSEAGTACDDGSQCTTEDVCGEGSCVGQPLQCSDDNDCTLDGCDPGLEGGCVFTDLDGLACDDGLPCTEADACQAGACSGATKTCDDGNSCTKDSCDVASGDCFNVSKIGDCDDDEECTINDSCNLGTCSGEPNPACVCTTDDECKDIGGTNPCKGTYACIEQVCQLDPATAFVCDQTGLGSCITSQCIAEGGEPTCQTIAQPDGTVCSDGNVCTSADSCQTGSCVGAIDPTVAGCGEYKIGWYSIASETMVWVTDKFRIIGTAAYPQIFGQAENDQYRVRALGTGL